MRIIIKNSGTFFQMNSKFKSYIITMLNSFDIEVFNNYDGY